MDKHGYSVTTQRQLRADFWAQHPFLVRKPGGQNRQTVKTRTAWVDYVDTLNKSGRISDALADRATL